MPAALAPTVPRGEAEVDEVAAPGSPAGVMTQPVPLAPEVVIDVSDEDESEDSAPLVDPVAVALASTAAPASVASTALDIPDPSAARRLFVELNHEAIGIPEMVA